VITPAVRKLVLVAHVTSSVGWLGAVGAFLALSIAGLKLEEAERIRGVYIAMDIVGWYVIVPLSIASLITGLIQSLTTSWGLFRHYWVVFKLLIAVVATGLLMLHMQPTSYLADVAATGPLSTMSHREIRIQLMADATAAILVLVVATVLSIYKPRGITPYGWKKECKRRAPNSLL
jgi:hypothetical protein